MDRNPHLWWILCWGLGLKRSLGRTRKRHPCWMRRVSNYSFLGNVCRPTKDISSVSCTSNSFPVLLLCLLEKRRADKLEVPWDPLCVVRCALCGVAVFLLCRALRVEQWSSCRALCNSQWSRSWCRDALRGFQWTRYGLCQWYCRALWSAQWSRRALCSGQRSRFPVVVVPDQLFRCALCCTRWPPTARCGTLAHHRWLGSVASAGTGGKHSTLE